ncbi:hypothetical protein SBOR_8074 [Sclerotinia borealis F-4128]|uniref:3-carboxymuconate cyclase n=1 Tax=Sclerotinia borealis (strain F-4128) TaxID=1432307 RepID=W9CAE6_SCLBF|nr:hypothetical protein SBOR_8074 [Sclerotinia borealis F-4128]
MFISYFLILAFASLQVLASRLFVASYTGTVSTLSLTENADGAYSLDVIATSAACAANPSWITLDHQRDVLYCSDRGLVASNGSLNSLKIQEDGSLAALDRVETPVGAVSTVLYADSTALAAAYFSSSSVGSFDITSSTNIVPLQSFTYNLTTPGLDSQYETAPHPHEAITDPTESFVLVPDLGSDLVRIYRINQDNKLLEPLEPLRTPTGSGPRHANWLVTESETYFYLVSQLTNRLTAYEVTYEKDETLSFEVKFERSLLETTTEGRELQFYSAAAGIQVTPDNNYLIISQRNDTHFTIPNPSSSSINEILSDSLLTYSLDHSNGNFSLISIDAAGGSFPRQFSINKAGDLLAVGLQNDGRVVIVKRDIVTGREMDIVAGLDVEGEVVCVVWDE